MTNGIEVERKGRKREEDGLVRPHGGVLVDRVVPASWFEEQGLFDERHPAVALTPRAEADAALIARGAYSPLAGFLKRADYAEVIASRRLADGALWPIPVTLPVDRESAESLRRAEWLRLLGDGGRFRGALRVQDLFRRDPEAEARGVFGTADPAHPGARQALSEPEWAVGGEILWLEESEAGAVDAWPRQTRIEFARRGWRRVVAFQTRNPVHRAHEYIQKAALESADGLLLHPLVGPTKDDDLPADVRLASYRALLDHYYPRDRAHLAVFPAPMRYAGPREALFHAIVRQNYGASHIIIGRDHAGVGKFYGPYDAHRIFETLAEGDLEIVPLFFDATFYCRVCAAVASVKTCPHGPESQVTLSGTQVRDLLRAGKVPPPEFTRPEVARVLIAALKEKEHEPERRG